MKSIVFVIGGCLLLNGCFLKQNPPNNLVSNGSAVNAVGIVRVEEISGAAASTTLEATFAEAKPQRGPRIIRDLDSLTGSLNRVQARTSGCNAYKIAKSRRDSVKLLSVGKLYFGPSFQENMSEIPENPDHAYKAVFKANLPAHLYAVKASGSPQIPGFTAPLSFPVPLENVTVASQSTELDEVTLVKETAVKFEWAAPAVPHSGHVMLMELYSDQPAETYLLRCLGLESDFGADGAKRVWNVPASYMALMPPTNDGLIFLSRVIAMPAGGPTLKVEAQGFQTNLVKFVLN